MKPDVVEKHRYCVHTYTVENLTISEKYTGTFNLALKGTSLEKG